MKKVLIVVDMQNDFVYNMEVLGSEYAQNIVPSVVEKVESYVNEGFPVVFTRDWHGNDYLSTREGRHLPILHCQDGEGWEIIPELAKYELFKNENTFLNTINKEDQFGLPVHIANELSSVVSTYEGQYKQIFHDIRDADEVEIVGVATNLCVLSIAVCLQNALPDKEIFIDASCCASYDPILHEKALDVLEGLQFNIINR